LDRLSTLFKLDSVQVDRAFPWTESTLLDRGQSRLKSNNRVERQSRDRVYSVQGKGQSRLCPSLTTESTCWTESTLSNLDRLSTLFKLDYVQVDRASTESWHLSKSTVSGSPLGQTVDSGFFNRVRANNCSRLR
jgi:hypothetical protein